MDDPRITFLTELIALLKASYSQKNLFLLKGKAGLGIQTVITISGGDSNTFNVKDKSNFRFISSHFAPTETAVMNLSWDFRNAVLISPEQVNFRTAFTWKLHDLRAMDEPGPAFQDDVSRGYWTTGNYFCKIRNS